jgi:putative ABC transport system permease protein
MLFDTLVRVAIDSLLAHKLRSFLAMLGIIVGVASMISMLSMVRGAEMEVMQQIADLGADVLFVRPGLFGAGGVVSGVQQNLSLDDARAIGAEVSQLELVAPVVRGTAQVKFLGRNVRTLLVGSSPEYFQVRSFPMHRGRAFTREETEGMSRVAVLGPTPAQRLFGDADPVGETIKVNGLNFRVIGVYAGKGEQGWMNLDDQVVVPYLNAMKQVFGLGYLSEIQARVSDSADIRPAVDGIASVLRRRHRLRPGTPDDFYVRTMAEVRDMASNIARTFTSLLGGIAGVSLAIGGIGIMNIMLVSVTERTREIGVRKAIGAKDRDILRQFVIEALMMSGTGGLLGVLLGISVASAIARLTDFSTRVETWSVVLALTSSAAIGVFFGFTPARNAARMDPIEALHYE